MPERPVAVRLPADLAARLHRLVPRLGAGYEQVAFLHGRRAAGRIEVTAIEPVPNTHRRPGSFGVAACDYRTARARGTLVGLFHTHVNNCRPSAADRRLLRLLPLVHVIGSPGPAPSLARLHSWIAAPNGSIRSLRLEVVHASLREGLDPSPGEDLRPSRREVCRPFHMEVIAR